MFNSIFRRRREPEPKSNLSYAESCKELINTLALENMLSVADSVAFLEHVRFRDEHKDNLHLTVKGYSIWAMSKGKIWMAYHEETAGALHLEWVSVISKFRR